MATDIAPPDLTGIPLDQLKDAPPVLATAIALYRERMKKSGLPLSSFNARI